MKNLRLLLVALAFATVVGTIAAGLWLDIVWALAVAVAGLIAVVLGTSTIQIQTLQTVSQRLARLRREQEETASAVQALESTVGSRKVETPNVTLPPEVKRAFNELTVASRSLTVPQVHFDQLLRTISANTVRTELALNDAVEEIRVLGLGGYPSPGARPGSGLADNRVEQEPRA